MHADLASSNQSFRFQLVVFDMDDTLYPEIDFVRSGYLAIAENLAAAASLDAQALFERMWHHFTAGDRRKVFDAVLEEFRLAGRFAVPDLVDSYRSHVPRIHLSPIACRVLASLRRAGCRLAVVTDGPLIMQQRKAQALRLADYIDQVVFTDALPPGCAKPSPVAFDQLMRRFAVPSQACVYVADNPRKDFVGPRQLGWYTVQFLTDAGVYAHELPPPAGQPHAVIRDLSELLALLS